MYNSPMKCSEEKAIPDAFTFLDGEKVTDAVGWQERTVEIRKMYEYYMYGPMPDALYEKVSYRLGKWNEKEVTVAFPDSAEKEGYLFMISAVTEEDWVNAAAIGLTYLEACKVFEFLGLRHHACLCEHLKGHAVLVSDMEKLLDYCDAVFYSEEEKVVQEVAAKHQTSVFWKNSGETRSISCSGRIPGAGKNIKP